MTTPPVRRNRARRAVTSLTAVATMGSLTAVGWVAGRAASQYDQQQADRAEVQARAAAKQARAQHRYDVWLAAKKSSELKAKVVLRPRRVKTVVTNHYVRAAAAPAPVGPAPVQSYTPAAPAAPAAPAPAAPAPVQHAAPPPPPPPPPAPAPSSGS